jgi:hypothetical protein
MPLAVVEPRSFPMLSTAYGDLADGLRGLAGDLGTLQAPAAEAERPPPTTTSVREAVEITARGMGAVFLQALLLGSVLLIGFQVWIVLFPPLRPTT